MSRGALINRTWTHDKLAKGSFTKQLIITANCSIHYCLIGEPHKGLCYRSCECCHMSQICVTWLLRNNMEKQNIWGQLGENLQTVWQRGTMPRSNSKNPSPSASGLVMMQKLQGCVDGGSQQMAFFMNIPNNDEQAPKLYEICLEVTWKNRRSPVSVAGCSSIE